MVYSTSQLAGTESSPSIFTISTLPFYSLSIPFLRPCNTCPQNTLLTLSCHDGLLKDKAVCCGCGSYVVDDGTGETVESSHSSCHKRRRLWRKSMICTSFMFSRQVVKTTADNVYGWLSYDISTPLDYNNSSKENPSFICFVAIVVTGHTRWLE